jgi:hypothetical protein
MEQKKQRVDLETKNLWFEATLMFAECKNISLKLLFILLMIQYDGLLANTRENCKLQILPPAFTASLRGNTYDQQNRPVHFQIQWIHDEASGNDTLYFIPENPRHISYTFIMVPTHQILLIGKEKYPRLMAQHHRRERIWGTPLRWDIFHLISQKNIPCDKKSAAWIRYYPNTSGTWFTIRVPVSLEYLPAPSAILSGIDNLEFQFSNYKLFGEYYLPGITQVVNEMGETLNLELEFFESTGEEGQLYNSKRWLF